MRHAFAALLAAAAIGLPAAAHAADPADEDYGYEEERSSAYDSDRVERRRVVVEEDEPYEERVIVRRRAPVYVDVAPPVYFGPRVVYRGWGPGPRFHGPRWRNRHWARRW